MPLLFTDENEKVVVKSDWSNLQDLNDLTSRFTRDSNSAFILPPPTYTGENSVLSVKLITTADIPYLMFIYTLEQPVSGGSGQAINETNSSQVDLASGSSNSLTFTRRG